MSKPKGQRTDLILKEFGYTNSGEFSEDGYPVWNRPDGGQLRVDQTFDAVKYITEDIHTDGWHKGWEEAGGED